MMTSRLNPQRTSTSSLETAIATASSSSSPAIGGGVVRATPTLFGLRFWLTCCFVSIIHESLYSLSNHVMIQSSSSSLLALQDELGAAWSPPVPPMTTANEIDKHRSLRGTTITTTSPSQPSAEQQPSIEQQLEEEQPQEEEQQPQEQVEFHTPVSPPSLTTSSALLTTNLVQQQEQDNNDDDSSSLSNSQQEAEYWSQNGCVYVENLCHSTYQFFYDNNNDDKSSLYQSNIELDLYNVFARGYPGSIQIGHSKPSGLGDTQCHYSPITHHLMYSTPFNHMMVEFYIRTMTGLKPILNNHTFLSKHPEHLQTYLILYNYAKILDGHRLFSNTLPTSNPILPFQSLMDSRHCTCMKRAIFCGFKNSTKTTIAVEETIENQDNQVDVADVSKDEVATNTTQSKNVTWSVLRPFADIGGKGIYREKKRYPGLRKHVRNELFDGDNQLISKMVQEYRLSQIKHFRNPNIKMSDIDDYILIGLTQRTGRRRWSNLKQVIAKCNSNPAFIQAKIICIEVNMDNTASHVIQQAVIHGSLQAFVGIHGSHFVNAVLLPKGATILEFQPWFPNWMRFGREWARRTDISTPVGSMFFNSDLNHVGLALERSSAPQLCTNYTMNTVEDDECLYALSQSKSTHDDIWWGTRDFSISYSVISTFIQQFMMPGDSKPDLCDDFKRIQSDHQIIMEGTNRSQSFTLYNVNCRDMATSKRVHTWHSYNNYTLDEEARLMVLVEQGLDKPPSKRKTTLTTTTTTTVNEDISNDKSESDLIQNNDIMTMTEAASEPAITATTTTTTVNDSGNESEVIQNDVMTITEAATESATATI